MKHVLIVLALCAVPCYAAVVVRGNDTTAPFAFKTAVQSQTYDRRTGMFFVGLSAGTDNGTFTISKANRPTFSSIPSFSSVLISDDPLSLQNSGIEFLSFSQQASTAKQVLIGVKQGSSVLTAQTVFGLFTDGSQQKETTQLHDAAGSDTAGIINSTSSSAYAFAGVSANGSFWGAANSGIALVGIDADSSTLTLTPKDAPAGIDGNMATPLNRTSTVLKGAGSDLMITGTQVALHWDEPMQRLFVGFSLQTNGGAGDVIKSVAVGRLNSGALTFQTVAPDAAISGGMNEIAVDKGSSSNAFAIQHLAVMHASTGPDYLIIDDSGRTTQRRIYAVPLVNDTSDTTAATNGTFAKYDSSLNATTKKFTTAASSGGDLLFDNAETRPEGVVGAGNLPIGPGDTISDLIVLGDAVYVSLGDNDTTLSNADRGIFVSHAMFDNEGRIIRWTPWSRRVIPYNAFQDTQLPGGATHAGSVSFFEVDGKTGNVWFVEGTTGKTVGITTWSTGQATNGLLQRLNSTMSNGIYSTLDLDQATRGFFGTTVNRYALFGGVNKVAFARISQAFSDSDASSDQTYSSSPQTSITDFSSDQNFLITDLPANAGCCQVLEYSRTSTTADALATNTDLNYFFAGTQTGLFVWSATGGTGFDPEDLGNLNATPFSMGSWQKIETISGSVIDIKTSGSNGSGLTGGTLYVLANSSTTSSPLASTLYAIPFRSTVSAMFAASNIRTVAQTGTGVFKNVLRFYGMQIIATDDARTQDVTDQEQLILATNQGLYISQADQAGGDGMITAANQTAAAWQLHEDSTNNLTTSTTMFNGIAGPNTPARQTAWPFNLKDVSNFSIFDRGNLNQLSGDGNGSTFEFNSFFEPSNFNANSTSSAFNSLDRIIHFFSDGGRRFFIVNRTQDPATQVKMSVLPYDATEWNISQPGILSDPTLQALSRFYGVNALGSAGIIISGTESGAVGIE